MTALTSTFASEPTTHEDKTRDSRSLTETLSAWASALRYTDIPPRTVEYARSQLISNLAAVRASAKHPIGRGIVAAFGPPLQQDPKQSAFVLSALATALDFDEVAYSGHVSAGSVNVALAYTATMSLNGKALLTAIVAANECAARITAATILGPFFRGQTNTHCHTVSAAAALLRATDAPAELWTSALGLALGVLATPIHHGVVTSDVKAFTAAAPVRMALDLCEAAKHGLKGSPRILEDPEGVLAHLSEVPVAETVLEGLGRRWHTDTLSYKRFPGSAYLHAAFDCAERLHGRVSEVGPSNIRRVVVHASILTWLLERKAASYSAGPSTSTSVATLSLGYGVASLLLTGRLTADDFAPPYLTNPSRWDLADKVTVVHDMAFTDRMVQATSPLGAALRQAGDRALQWPELIAWGGADVSRRLAELGPPEVDFETATMAIGARVEVEFDDGSVLVEQFDAQVGAAGPATARDHASIVGTKFLETGGCPEVLAGLQRVDAHDAELLADLLRRSVQ